MADEALDFGFMSFPAEVQEEIMAMTPKRPKRGRSRDGIYPRCVWCDGENYALAVIAYSRGEIPCASTTNCGRYVPDDYITYTKEPHGTDGREPDDLPGGLPGQAPSPG